MSEELDLRARLTATNEMSSVIRQVVADFKKLESLAKSFNSSFAGIGRAGVQSMAAFDRVAKNAAAQLLGIGNANKAAARSFADDWQRATSERVNDARRMYSQLERMESGYQRQLDRRIATERRVERSAGRSAGSLGTGRIPAPRLGTIALGGGIVGAGVASALKKRMEVQAAEVRGQMFGDLSANEVKDLRQKYADRLGIRFGVGTTKALDAMVEGAKAGILKKDLGDFGELSLSAQAGLDIPVDDIAKLGGRLATQLTFTKERFSKIFNAIAVVNNDTAANGKEIVDAMRRGLSALASTHMTPEQLSAITGTAISLGIQPFKAGTFTSFLTSQIAGADSARGQQALDLTRAANALGFGGRASMAQQMRDNPIATIQQILDNLAKLPEKLRTKVSKQIGGREWMDELLTVVLGHDKLRDVLRDVDTKQGFLNKVAMQKIRSLQGRWASVQAAFGLVLERAGAGFETMFDQITDSIIDLADKFNFDAVRDHFAAFVEGIRDGFSFRDWGETVKSLAGIFDAGSIERWRQFGRGLAESFKQIASDIKVAFNTMAFVTGKSDAEGMGKLAGEIIGLATALAVLAPVLATLAAFTAIIRGVARALGGRALLGGSPVGTAVWMAWLLARNNNTDLPDTSHKLPGETTSQWRERQKKHRELQRYKPSGDPTFQPSSYIGDGLNKLNANIQRAAFLTYGGYSGGGGIQNAFVGGGGGRYDGGSSGSPNVMSLLRSTPGAALPNFGIGSSGSIIRRGSRAGGLLPSDAGMVVRDKKWFEGNGGPADMSVGQGLSGNAFLQARRAKFAEEIKNDPNLRLHLAAMQMTEGASRGGTIESLMNRTDMLGSTLRKMLGYSADGRINPRSFYGPIRRGELGPAIERLKRNPALFAKYDAYTQRALAGSHIIGGYTDQGLPTDPNGSARTGIPGLRLRDPRTGRVDGNEFTDWAGVGRQKAINWRHFYEKGINGSSDSLIGNVPSPADAVKNVPASPLPGAGASDVHRTPGSVAIHINGNSHDPEALATLVQRRIDESMNWRTHDTASEYT